MTTATTPQTQSCPCCDTQIRLDSLLCLDHWKPLPQPIKEEVSAAFRAWRRQPTLEAVAALRAAQAEAIRLARLLPRDPRESR